LKGRTKKTKNTKEKKQPTDTDKRCRVPTEGVRLNTLSILEVALHISDRPGGKKGPKKHNRGGTGANVLPRKKAKRETI